MVGGGRPRVDVTVRKRRADGQRRHRRRQLHHRTPKVMRHVMERVELPMLDHLRTLRVCNVHILSLSLGCMYN